MFSFMRKNKHMDLDLINLKRKVDQYKTIIANTRQYRQTWTDSLKDQIVNTLQAMIDGTELGATIEIRSDLENLEAIVLSLGEVKSGMYQKVTDDIKRHMIKHNGSLIYQQLFNGKVIVLINYPSIEGYGQPRPPKNVAIYRPEEIKEPYLIRHMEEFIKEVTNWEDYDDDEPAQRIGYQMNFGAGVENPEPA